MGEKLLQYYKYMGNIQGVSGKAKLAMYTKVPSPLAATIPDDPETISKFKKAIKELTGNSVPNF